MKTILLSIVTIAAISCSNSDKKIADIPWMLTHTVTGSEINTGEEVFTIILNADGTISSTESDFFETMTWKLKEDSIHFYDNKVHRSSWLVSMKSETEMTFESYDKDLGSKVKWYFKKRG